MVIAGGDISVGVGNSADEHDATNPARSVASATSVTPFVLTIYSSLSIVAIATSGNPHM